MRSAGAQSRTALVLMCSTGGHGHTQHRFQCAEQVLTVT